MTASIIQSLTPAILALVGTTLGVGAILNSQNLSDARWAATIGLAGTAIAGAAGAAQARSDVKSDRS